jgi:RES domain-containing protein
VEASPSHVEAYSNFFQGVFGESRENLANEIEKITPVQAVPSVIIPREMNYLISPAHPQFDQLAWGEPQPFRFDPRLIGSTAE